MNFFADAPRVAMLSVHTSPLDQPGTGDAGGMNVYVAELSRALARRGAEVEIFTRATSSEQPAVTPLDEGDGRVLVRHIEAGPFEGLDKNELPGQMCAFAAGVLRTEAGAAPGRYDVVHSHYWLSGQVGFLAAERWHVPLVHTMHTLAKVKNDALAPGDSPEPAGRVIGEEQVVHAADGLVASTPEEAEVLIDAYDADPAAVHVVAPGVDLETFAPGSRAEARERLGLPQHRKIMLFAGRLQPLKGTDVLVHALAELAGSAGRSGVAERAGSAGQAGSTDLAGAEPPLFVVVGGPSGRLTAARELEALAHVLGVRDSLELRPAAPQDVLADYYRAADVVAMPSRSESFGLVAAEAQAVGTPVVAAAVGGLRSVVVDGATGLLVPGHDPRDWAAALRSVLEDPELHATLASGARSMRERFAWDAAAAEILKVYSVTALNSPRSQLASQGR